MPPIISPFVHTSHSVGVAARGQAERRVPRRPPWPSDNNSFHVPGCARTEYFTGARAYVTAVVLAGVGVYSSKPTPKLSYISWQTHGAPPSANGRGWSSTATMPLGITTWTRILFLKCPKDRCLL
ncbi:hypothetical protein CBL_07537 [Carabus blaptoides fortunei]